MSAPQPAPEDEIFCDAVELPLGSRAEFIRQRCGTNERLLAAVMRLVQAYESDPAFLEGSVGDYLTLEFGAASRFERVRRLGSGGYGTVYEAWDREERRAVAVKVPKTPEAQELLDFKREFRSLARYENANFVKLYELFEQGHQWFFTMELVDGSDFVSFVRGAPGRLRSALAQLAQALFSLHHEFRILHRDIKPSNVLVTGAGTVKLLDFGLARDISNASARTRRLAGTPAYMAPESMADGTLVAASDWYSLGVMLYEALTGRIPFDGDYFAVRDLKMRADVLAPRHANPEAPDDLSELCVALLARDPSARPEGAEVLRRLAWEPPPLIPRGATNAELIGRGPALQQLRDALHRRSNVCIHVRGRSGMGKSALCSAFLTEAARAGAMVLAGRCYENESIPYKALDPVVDSLAGHLKGLGSLEVMALLPREGPVRALAHVFPTLLAVKAIDQSYAAIDRDASRRDLQRQAIAGLGEILARIAQNRPCIVAIDDLQWGDMDSVESLAAILTSSDPPRALFLFSYRSEDLDADHLKRLRALPSEVIEVAELNAHDSAELARTLLGETSEYLEVAREAEGMPLLIHELAMHARSGLRRDDSAPERLSLLSIIRKRVELLPEATRRILEAVSVAARPLEFEVARQAAGVTEPISRYSLSGSERLLRSKDNALEPFHDKIREAVLAGLDESTKRAIYRALAGTLEARETADPEVVYQYYLQAADMAKAAAYLEIAASRAEAQMAFDLAVRLRLQRLEMGPSSDAERSAQQELLAQAYALAGRGLAAAKMFQDAAQAAEPARQHRLIRNAGEQYIRAGNFERGCALLTALLQHLGYRAPTRRWQILPLLFLDRSLIFVHRRGWVRRRNSMATEAEAERLEICRVTSLALALQDPLRSAELQARHLLHALRLGEPYRIANSLSMEAGYVAARGGAAAYPAAMKLLEQVKALTARSDHPNSQTLAVSVGCKVAWLTGRWQDAALLGEEVNRLATEQYTRVAWEAYPSSIFWICSLACMGRWREVLTRLPGLEAESEARGDLLAKISLPVFTLAYVRWLLADESAKAGEELRVANSRLAEPGFVPHRFGVSFGLAEVALYEGDLAAARATVKKGWQELESALVLKLQPVRILMLHLLGRVVCAQAAVQDDEKVRRKLLAEAKKSALKIRQEETAWGNGIALLLEASIAFQQGRPDEARTVLERADVACRSVGMEHFAAVARYWRGQLDCAPLLPSWFQAQQVKNPEGLARMLCPGLG